MSKEEGDEADPYRGSSSTSPCTSPVEQRIAEHTHEQERTEVVTQTPPYGGPSMSLPIPALEQRTPKHTHDQGMNEVMEQAPPPACPPTSPSTPSVEETSPQQAPNQERKDVMTQTLPRGCPSTTLSMLEIEQRTPNRTHDQGMNEVVDQTLPPACLSTSPSGPSLVQTIPEHTPNQDRKEMMTQTPPQGCPSTTPSMPEIEQRTPEQKIEDGRSEIMAKSSQRYCTESMDQSCSYQRHTEETEEVTAQSPHVGSPSTELVVPSKLEETQDHGRAEIITQNTQLWGTFTKFTEQRSLDQAHDEEWQEGVTQTLQADDKPLEQRTLEETHDEGWQDEMCQVPLPDNESKNIVDQQILEETQDEGWCKTMAQHPQHSGKSTEFLEQAQNEERNNIMTETSHLCSPLSEPEEQRTLGLTQAEEQKFSNEERESSKHVPVGGQSATVLRKGGPLLERSPSFGKSVKFLLPAVTIDDTSPKEDELRFFQEVEKMLGFKKKNFKSLFTSVQWRDLTENKLLRKRILKEGLGESTKPLRGQEVTVQLLGIREDGTLVEKDPKLVFILDEGDVIQALELCVQSMQQGEECFLLTDALYAFGLLGRDPDIPPDAALLYNVTLLHVRDRPSLEAMTAADCISLGSQKRECGNFHFEREEYGGAMRSYNRALSILESPDTASLSPEENEELCEHRIKCLNNIAATQLKLHLFEQVLASCDAVLELNMDNVKALYRKGKLLSERGDHEEAMNILKRALKLEPTTKAIHAELSKLVRRKKGLPEIPSRPKTRALLKIRGDLNPLMPRHSSTWKRIPPWTMILGAIAAVASIVIAVLLTQERK